MNKILIPLDGSDVGEATLPYVKELAKKLESQLILLQVLAPGQHVHTIGRLDYVLFAKQQVESMKTEAKEYLEKVSKKLTGARETIRFEVKINFLDNTVPYGVKDLYDGRLRDSTNTIPANTARVQINSPTGTGQFAGNA